jgi:predicted ATPase
VEFAGAGAWRLRRLLLDTEGDVMSQLKSLTIRGFKSIEKLEGFRLDKLNLLIGGNGAGKSNFVDFFRMLRALADEAFQKFVNEQGGGDGLFFLGPKYTSEIFASMEFGQYGYEFELRPTAASKIQISTELVRFTGLYPKGTLHPIGAGAWESNLMSQKNDQAMVGSGTEVPGHVYDAISSWTVYHFHDTSMLAPMRRDQLVQDRERLRPNASNIAAFLLHLSKSHKDCYQLIRNTVRLIAPFFANFLLRPEGRGGNEQVRLEWRQIGSDFPFQPNHLSDGTIRFVCLATALLQPNPPATIVIDEPELGLHPFALSILADLIQSAAERTQIIVSTQSPTLVDYFEPKDIIVVNRSGGRSEFKRLEADQLKEWLDDYSLGELWQKNVVRAGPTHE